MPLRRGDSDRVKLYDVNYTNGFLNGMTPLHEAIYEDHEEIVKLLLERGADPNIRDENGKTPLHEAIYKCHEEIVMLLLQHGADPNIRDEKGNTPLHEAIYEDHEEILKLLLERGADPNIRDEGGWTSLRVAVCAEHVGSAKFLLECGADPNIADEYGRTPLHEAAFGGLGDMVNRILEHVPDPFNTSEDDSPLLHESAYEANVKLLLEYGADPYITDKDKKTPYDMAVERNHEGIKKILQRIGSPWIQTHLLQKLIATISDQVSVRRIRFLGRRLGVPDAKLDNIKSQNPNNVQEEAYQTLRQWMEMTTGATVHNLFKALKEQQLNACLDLVKNEYFTLCKEILAKSEDEFKTFCSSLEYTHGVTLSDMKEIDIRIYVSDGMRYLGFPLERFNARRRMVVYRLEWMGNYDTPPPFD